MCHSMEHTYYVGIHQPRFEYYQLYDISRPDTINGCMRVIHETRSESLKHRIHMYVSYLSRDMILYGG